MVRNMNFRLDELLERNLIQKCSKHKECYVCDKCTKTLKTPTSLTAHKYRHCDICSNLAPNLVQLKKHRKACQRKSKTRSGKDDTINCSFL